MQVQFLVRFSAKLAGIAVALLLAFASHASAATITATYTGTVKNAFDTTGVFGTPGADLAGAGYTLVFAINPSVGSYSTFNGTIGDPLLSGDQVFGGMSAALTINGHSYAFTGGGSPSGNYDIVATKPGFGGILQQVGGPSSSVRSFLSSTNPGPGFPTSVYTAFVLSSCPGVSCIADLAFGIQGGPSGSFGGTLNFGSLSVTTTPIPATLQLLVSALGGLGFFGWRRRKQQAV
jgi:hypothetical protein